MPRIGKLVEIESTTEIIRGWGDGGGMGKDCLMSTEFLGDDEKVLELGSGDSCTTL